MQTTPTAFLKAQRLIRQLTHRTIPAHRIRLELTTEPDQYRVSYTFPNPAEDGVVNALIPRLTLTPFEYQAAEAWLDARYPGGRP